MTKAAGGVTVLPGPPEARRVSFPHVSLQCPAYPGVVILSSTWAGYTDKGRLMAYFLGLGVAFCWFYIMFIILLIVLGCGALRCVGS